MTSVFILVRHALAGEKRAWQGPDRERPLSPVGRQQALGLAKNPTLRRGARLLSSPYLRCVQTLEPMAQRMGVTIGTSDLLGPEGEVSELDAMLMGPASEGLVVCTHGETLTSLLRRWYRRSSVSLPLKPTQLRKGATEKGGAWVVADDGAGWEAHYLRPVASGP